MIYNNFSNVIGELISKILNAKCSFLDANNIVWKLINNEWTGKRSVWTKDFRACWLEDTTVSNVKSYWCGGEDADYTEIFKRKKSTSTVFKYLFKEMVN